MMTPEYAQMECEAVRDTLQKQQTALAERARYLIRDIMLSEKIETLDGIARLLDQTQNLPYVRRKCAAERDELSKKILGTHPSQKYPRRDAKWRSRRDTLDDFVDFVDGRKSFIPRRIDW